MLSGLSNRGRLKIDTGAALALRKQNRSLLAAGIKEIEGSFKRGDIITIYSLNGDRIGCGISNYSTAEINKIKGSH
ncbi:MAG: glutamate 5-kinase, partial [Aliifodinibius sp.]|nr:glutamate 5-kinase [Phycisphaerae bacterium]NIT57983.1 glutamate 5-kinase [Fodinibius sp.]NIY26565.1 glutamate 5-kinase [Fodinibius sp.]